MTKRSGAARKWGQRLGPPLVTVIVILALLRRYPARDVLAAVREGHALSMVPIVLAFAVGHLLLVSLWDWVLLGSVVSGLAYRDLVRAKAACSMLQAIAYGAQQGAYGLWIARATGVGGRNATGLVLCTVASDFTAGCLFTTAAVWLGSAKVPLLLRIGPAVVAVVMLAIMFLPTRRPLDPRVERTVIGVWRAVPRLRGIGQTLARTLNFSSIIVATWLGARVFGMPLPLSVVASYLPVVAVVGSLPINVGGLGPVQGAWLLFLPWAGGARILAFQLTLQAMLMLATVLRGAPFVSRVAREMSRVPFPAAAATEPAA